MQFRSVWISVIFILLCNFAAISASGQAPGPRDKCPVCGMFTSKYQDFLGAIDLDGGKRLWFDGAKDLFKFYLDPAAYGEGSRGQNTKTILVTDYYTVQLIEARSAWYVLGSDIFGPMGHELIPFAKEADAQVFMADHGGKRLLRFNEINAELLQGLE